MSDWTNPASGTWTNASRWTGGVPNGAGAVANFAAVGSSSAAQITFAQGTVTIGTLNVVTGPNYAYDFLGDVGVTNATLRFQGAGGGPAFLTVDTNGSTNTSDMRDANGFRIELASDLILTTVGSDTFFNIEASISGSPDIYKFGDGTLRLSGSNPSFTGDFSLNGGRLELVNGTALDASNLIRITNGATLATVNSNVTLSSDIETGSGNAKAVIAAQTGRTLTLSGQLELRSSANEAVKFGSAADAGTIVLSGTSLIHGTGSFDIAGGAVRLGSAGVAANYFSGMTGGAHVLVATGAIFDTGGFASTIRNLVLGGSLQSTGGALDLTSDIFGLSLIENGSIIGTAQADRLVFNVSEASISLQSASFTGWTNGVDTITLNALTASGITGTSQNDVINGSAGNDQLAGAGGLDTIRGGAGDDQYSIADTLSTLIENPGEGTDTIIVINGGPTQFTLAANFENLTFQGSAQHTGNGNAANNLLIGGSGIDTLSGAGGNDTLQGSGGNDTLIGGAGADVLDGGAGNDRLYVDSVHDQLVEASGGGTDILLSSVSFVLTDSAFVEGLSTTNIAGTDAINLTGNSLDNGMSGNAGANILNGGGGADAMQGFGGNDRYVVDNALDKVIEAAGGGTDIVLASVDYVLADSANVEALTTTNNAGTAAINLTGNNLANGMSGNAGANILNGGVGADAMQGFGGNDVYIVDNSLDKVIELAGGGTDEIRTALASFSLAAIAQVENLTGLAGAGQTLTGNALDNVLTGAAGNDTLVGGAGADTMAGGLGNDRMYIDSALDQLVEASGGGTDILLSSVSYVLANGVFVEALATTNNAGTTAINLTGNNLDNGMSGNAGANILDGGAGVDVMQGFGGNDRYAVDNVLDRVLEASAGGTDILLSSVSFTITDSVFVESLATTNVALTTAINLTGNNLDNSISGNAGVNVLNGNAGNDSLFGLGGNDTLQGGVGNDSLFGGLGADSLTGGAGTDAFRFDSALGGGNVDTIADFVAVDDTILIDNAVFTGLALGALAAGAFRTGAAAADADDRIIYNNATGALLFDADGVGGVAAVQFATLTGAPAITAGDFVVI